MALLLIYGKRALVAADDMLIGLLGHLELCFIS